MKTKPLQNYVAQEVLRGKFIAVSAYIKKKKRTISNK
jgi:hypothetical protein